MQANEAKKRKLFSDLLGDTGRLIYEEVLQWHNLLYHIPSTVFALRTLFYWHVEQALAVLPVSQTMAETGADTQEVDLSPRLRVISVLQFQSLFKKKIAYFTFKFLIK